ncbi:MAG: SGNH/GDSL hydrolase family protein, partial [Pseudomonadota bacterium]|nr:SGNH/GDSL hydrolase family protein [Pseudomonadota bacterium]
MLRQMKWAAGLMLALLAGCGELQGTGEQARILAMGDSMLAWNGTAHQSVSFAIEQELGEPVVDRSVS